MPVVRRARRFAGLALADFLASRPTGLCCSDGTEAWKPATAPCPPSSCSPAAAHAVVITVAVNAGASLVLLCLLSLIAPGLWSGLRSAICVGLSLTASTLPGPSGTILALLSPFRNASLYHAAPSCDCATAQARAFAHFLSFSSTSPSTLTALIPAAHHGFVCFTASARVPLFVGGLLTTCFPASRIGSVFRSFWHTMTSDDRREHAVRKPTTSVAVC